MYIVKGREEILFTGETKKECEEFIEFIRKKFPNHTKMSIYYKDGGSY